MAEDLTDYLDEHGIRVRYLHSDIDTVERVETVSYTHLHQLGQNVTIWITSPHNYLMRQLLRQQVLWATLWLALQNQV